MSNPREKRAVQQCAALLFFNTFDQTTEMDYGVAYVIIAAAVFLWIYEVEDIPLKRIDPIDIVAWPRLFFYPLLSRRE